MKTESRSLLADLRSRSKSFGREAGRNQIRMLIRAIRTQRARAAQV